MQSTSSEISIISFIPFFLVTGFVGVSGNLLARDKGRPLLRGTILCLIPFFGVYFLIYLVGCTGLRLEAKLDAILKAQNHKSGEV